MAQRVSESLLEDIISRVRLDSPDLVRSWFAELAAAEMNHGTIEIQPKNGAQWRYLSQTCLPSFTAAAQDCTGKLVTVRFTSPAEDEGSAPPSASMLDNLRQAVVPAFTFDQFVVGPSNRLAHAASVSVASGPGKSYNPLFIHGRTGMGKTHLLQAVAQEMSEADRSLNAAYVSCEMFVNRFVEAVEDATVDQFHAVFHSLDALIVDDVQFLDSRERTQEEFFRIYNSLHQAGKQLVFSADFSPSELSGIADRLITRFNSGLVALLDQPIFETRLAILQKKAKFRCIEAPAAILEQLASTESATIRDMEESLVEWEGQSQKENQNPAR